MLIARSKKSISFSPMMIARVLLFDEKITEGFFARVYCCSKSILFRCFSIAVLFFFQTKQIAGSGREREREVMHA